MKVWLIDHNSGIPNANSSEGQRVRRGIRNRLDDWFSLVARHPNAQSDRPAGHGTSIDVAWASSASGAGQFDIVLHFVPSNPGSNPPVMGPYREAASQISNRQVADRLANTRRDRSGGRTLGASVGNQRVPTLSLVIVLYDAQFSDESMRVQTNVERLSIIAFHEAAHNKDRSNSLHRAGGGGIFADIHTGGLGSGNRPNPENISFLAERIWNWGPQYLLGGSMALVSPP